MFKRVLFIILTILLTSGLAFAGTINLSRTGQTKCYNASGTEISCAGTGQDGEFQKGIGWSGQRFSVVGDCVVDNLTGLMWARNGNLSRNVSGDDWGITWQQSIDYVKSLNNSGLCGYKDWRVPNLNELESLINSGTPNSASWLVSQGFFNVGEFYCTSDTHVPGNPSWNWFVDMVQGNVDAYLKTNKWYVWPVRSGFVVPSALSKTGQAKCYDVSGNVISCAGTAQDGELQKGVTWPNPRFTVSGSCITDNLTGLMWKKDLDWDFSPRTWQEALDYANGLNLCNYSDWRLPNREELKSLVNYGETSASNWLMSQGFTGLVNGYYWTSTNYGFNPVPPLNANSSYAWYVSLWDGWVYPGLKSNRKIGVVGVFALPVRSGSSAAYWPGWDIAMAISAAPGGTGVYVLDGFGGVHAQGGAPVITKNPTPYWGWDIARDITFISNDSYYVLDGWGGIHRGGNAPVISATTYWPYWDIARAIAAAPGGTGVYVLDGFGGVHAQGGANPINPPATYFGFNIAKDIAIVPTGNGCYVLNRFGAVFPGGTATSIYPF